MTRSRTVEVVRHLLDLIGDAAVREHRRGVRDELCTCARALLDALEDPQALVAVCRAAHEVALARDEAILAECPADAALLDAAVRVGSAVELLVEGEVDEARAYAGASLMPLAEARVFAGSDASVEEALAVLKAELKARLQRSSA